MEASCQQANYISSFYPVNDNGLVKFDYLKSQKYYLFSEFSDVFDTEDKIKTTYE